MIRFACAIGLLAGAASAQSVQMIQLPCNSRDAVIASLAITYAEEIRVQGLDGRGLMFEVFANEATDTWTAALTDPAGRTCILGAGEGIEFVRSLLTAPDY